jgi:transcriptional regulator with XRE-family HTH domain
VSAKTDTPIQPIAKNLKRLRTERELSLSALARKANVSKSTLFNLERGDGNPAVDTLWALAGALGVPIGALFLDPSLAAISVLRHAQAPVLVREDSGGHDYAPPNHDPDDAAFVTRHLLSSSATGQCELFWMEIDANVTRTAHAHSAGVVEHVVSTRGEVEIAVEDRWTLLRRGDRISFPADREHVYRTSDAPASLISLLDYP